MLFDDSTTFLYYRNINISYQMLICRDEVFPDGFEHAAHDVNVVEDREHDEKPVEGVAHLLRAQHRDHKTVGNKSQKTLRKEVKCSNFNIKSKP